MNRIDELKTIIVKALETPNGFLLSVTGGERNKIQAALAALTAAKRELLPDFPELLNIQFRRLPDQDTIAIYRIRDPLEDQEEE